MTKYVGESGIFGRQFIKINHTTRQARLEL
jgi:hypothetical protein